ncbi:MAG TPA: dTDP-4-dehydrorhamnose 3,5-epimerase [Fimbriiglobus sp.]|jgi:dTDP-4-dehydrorhamnose 3,5-epimerase|nr:dTDP-4-dehydrorhamnose 3,5-epimerase [Fimbriiglobus sp.]
MRFLPTNLAGAYVIEPEPRTDERGLFARTYCRDEFATHGLNTTWVQCNVSFNRLRCTLRGMHWQAEPHAEVKLVRCTRGAAFDVIADLRPDSPTCRQWVGVELTAENRRTVYIPAGFAHGFQTLADDTELFYQMSEFYHPDLARGARWDDPALGIEWPPAAHRVIAARDLSFPDLPT